MTDSVLNLIKKVGESEKARQSFIIFIKENQKTLRLIIHGVYLKFLELNIITKKKDSIE